MIRTAAILLALSAPAWGQAVLPPAEYDHPFDGRVDVWVVEGADVNKTCNNPKANLGCAYLLKEPIRLCTIVMAPDDVIRARGFTPEIVKRHEIGHCNGWPADHPGARFAAKGDKQ